jgi:hypothetical protein
MIEATLAAAAFGNDPGRWPLPTAYSPYELWLRAVAAGGQGRYSCARADLAALCRGEPSGPLASLAHSTQASFLRQLGWHRLAGGSDGRALALTPPTAETAGLATDAVVDALIGLAADALGVSRFAASAALLRRARDHLAAADAPAHRLGVRMAWVSAELAMAVGAGHDAVLHAERAVELAGALFAVPVSARHRAKSDVVLAAALCSAGSIERARAVADAALEATGRSGLVPLRWAVACLLADIGSATHTTDEVQAIRDVSAALVRHRGGLWCDR